MTVKELITALMAFDPDTTVVVPDNEECTKLFPWAGISDVRYMQQRFYDVEPNGTSGYKTDHVVRLEGF